MVKPNKTYKRKTHSKSRNNKEQKKLKKTYQKHTRRSHKSSKRFRNKRGTKSHRKNNTNQKKIPQQGGRYPNIENVRYLLNESIMPKSLPRNYFGFSDEEKDFLDDLQEQVTEYEYDDPDMEDDVTIKKVPLTIKIILNALITKEQIKIYKAKNKKENQKENQKETDTDEEFEIFKYINHPDSNFIHELNLELEEYTNELFNWFEDMLDNKNILDEVKNMLNEYEVEDILNNEKIFDKEYYTELLKYIKYFNKNVGEIMILLRKYNVPLEDSKNMCNKFFKGEYTDHDINILTYFLSSLKALDYKNTYTGDFAKEIIQITKKILTMDPENKKKNIKKFTESLRQQMIKDIDNIKNTNTRQKKSFSTLMNTVYDESFPTEVY